MAGSSHGENITWREKGVWRLTSTVGVDDGEERSNEVHHQAVVPVHTNTGFPQESRHILRLIGVMAA